MTGKTHKSGGYLFALLTLNFFIVNFLSSYNIFYKVLLIFLYFYAAHIGSLFPDIDQRKSDISKSLPIISKLFGTKMRHRGFTHSLLFISILGLILGFIIFITDYNIIAISIAFGFLIGYISHLVLDLLTENGIEIFYPCKINFKLATINTGSKVEKFLNKTFKVLIWILIVYNILLLFDFSIFNIIG